MRANDLPLANDFVTDDEFDRLLNAWFGNIARVLVPGGSFYIWGGYSFKLATLCYACRLLGLDREFPTELEKIHRRLISAQLKSGGIAHFFDVEAQSDSVHACPDAIGEATAIYILAMAIVPNQMARK
jgi:hypothetical protein